MQWFVNHLAAFAKCSALEAATLAALEAVDVTPKKAPWPFKKSDRSLRELYFGFPGVADWFSPNGRPAPGIVTTHDQFAISWNEGEAREKVERFLTTSNESEARGIWKLCSQDQWNYDRAKSILADEAWRDFVTPIAYRPFDKRYTVYDQNIAVHRRERVMSHMRNGKNIAIACSRQNKGVTGFHHVTCHIEIAESSLVSNKTSEISSCFPLYLYPDEQDLDQSRRVNFDPKLYARLQALATHPTHGTPDEVAVFDYIYGLLHCPAYRATYAEFLKIDFPRIPWPTTPDAFWDISAKGGMLRRLHLMDPTAIGPTPYPFEGQGDGIIVKPRLENGRVWINATQSFANAPEVAWGFYIGGYQPAQKWLKDRKGRQLSFDDIQHYQRILKILSETDRIMRTIAMELSEARARD